MNEQASAALLNAHLWKKRLIVASVARDEERDQLAALLVANRGALEERDVEVINVSPGPAPVAGTIRLDPQQTAALRNQLKLNERDAGAVFVLIGKDGREKSRQRGELDLASWFALIDAMPMRREEIRSRERSRQ